METKGNHVLIGLFAICTVVAAFAFVFWFNNIGGTAKRVPYLVRFEGSAAGLRPGSSVLFNGIRMGEVMKISVNPDDPHQVIARVEVDARTPIRTDTAVGLDFQGLTGVSSIALTGGSKEAPGFMRYGDEPPMLIADSSASQDVTRAVRDVVAKVDALLTENGSLNNTFKNIEQFSETLAKDGSLHNAARSIEIFTKVLADNAEHIDSIIAGLDNLSGGPDGKGDIQEAARSIKQLVDNLDKRTAAISAGINKFTAVGAREMESIAQEGRRTLSEINTAVKNFDRNPSRIIFGGQGSSVPQYNSAR